MKGWSENRTGEFQLNGGSATGFNTFMNFDGGGPAGAGGAHIETSSTATQGTYVLYSGLSGDSTVDIRRINSNIMVAGLQIVEVSAAVPEPSTAVLLGLGGFALILRRRK